MVNLCTKCQTNVKEIGVWCKECVGVGKTKVQKLNDSLNDIINTEGWDGEVLKKDTSTISCKDCGETKVRILAGKRGKDKIWVDETGREYNGLRCPSCHSSKVNQLTKIKKKNSYV